MHLPIVAKRPVAGGPGLQIGMDTPQVTGVDLIGAVQ